MLGAGRVVSCEEMGSGGVGAEGGGGEVIKAQKSTVRQDTVFEIKSTRT